VDVGPPTRSILTSYADNNDQARAHAQGPQLIDAALNLAALGWQVFPCIWWSGESAKAPLVKNGFHDATSDPRLIKRWWTKWPAAMIGAAVPAWLVVLDIDPRHGGSLDALEQLAGPMPTLAAWSGRGDGGRHLYFQRPLGPLTSTRLPAGVDLKVGGKGYCIVPPSIHPDTGEAYRWESRRAPAILPDRLQGLLTPAPKPIYRPSNRNTSAVGLLRKVAETPEGNRNDALFWAACRAGEDGILDQIEDQLLAAALAAGEIETKARRTIASARRTTQ
jgi:hypothetical protein